MRPLARVPRGSGTPEPGEMGSLWRARGVRPGGSVGRGVRARALEPAALLVNWGGSPAPTPCLPGDSAGASLRSLCVKGGGLAVVTWRAEALPRLEFVRSARGRGLWGPLCPAGVWAGSLRPGVGRAYGPGGPPASATLARGGCWEGRASLGGLGFLRVARSLAALLPSPPPASNSCLLVCCGGGNGKEERVTFPNY